MVTDRSQGGSSIYDGSLEIMVTHTHTYTRDISHCLGSHKDWSVFWMLDVMLKPSCSANKNRRSPS